VVVGLTVVLVGGAVVLVGVVVVGTMVLVGAVVLVGIVVVGAVVVVGIVVVGAVVLVGAVVVVTGLVVVVDEAEELQLTPCSEHPWSVSPPMLLSCIVIFESAYPQPAEGVPQLPARLSARAAIPKPLLPLSVLP
jgi:hypothetical protein